MPIRISQQYRTWSAGVIRWGWRKLLTLLHRENIPPLRPRIRQTVPLPGGVQLTGFSTELTSDKTKPEELQNLELRRWERICQGQFTADFLDLAQRGAVVQTIVWRLDSKKDHVLMSVRKE